MLKAVIFDFDGTVCDTLPLCIAAFRKSIEPLAGRRFSDQEITATFGPSEEGTIRALIPEFYEQGVADYLKHYRDLHAMCPAPFGGIPELLRELRRKHVITALVTGKGRRSCDISLAYYGVAELFDVVETGSPSGPDKPEGIRRVLKQFRLKEEEAVYVGDAPSDIQSARTAGIPVISAAWAPSAEQEVLLSLKPDRIFYSVADFRSYLDSLMHGMK